MIKEAIIKIVNKKDLSYNEAYTVMNEIMSGKTTSTQNACLQHYQQKVLEPKQLMKLPAVLQQCENMQ